jgi:hypothetical protein
MYGTPGGLHGFASLCGPAPLRSTVLPRLSLGRRTADFDMSGLQIEITNK